MKLDRILGLTVTAVALFAIEGCASHTARATAPKSSFLADATPQAATTQLMAAELTDADDAPRVGKSHTTRSEAGVDERDATDVKDAPRRDDRKHNGGGFSGWK